MRTGYRTQDFYRIKSDRDGLYYAAAIPSTFWSPPFQYEVRFKPLVLDDETTVSPAVQREWFSRMRGGELFSKPYMVLLCTDGDDGVSLKVGYDVMKEALHDGRRVHITDSSDVPTDVFREETIFMLTNVYEESPPDRLQLIRDWVRRHDSCFRLVAAAGDAAEVIRKLRVNFNAVFSLETKVVIEKDFA